MIINLVPRLIMTRNQLWQNLPFRQNLGRWHKLAAKNVLLPRSQILHSSWHPLPKSDDPTRTSQEILEPAGQPIPTFKAPTIYVVDECDGPTVTSPSSKTSMAKRHSTGDASNVEGWGPNLFQGRILQTFFLVNQCQTHYSVEISYFADLAKFTAQSNNVG